MTNTDLKPAGDNAVAVAPGAFQSSRHFYGKVLGAALHPLVAEFLSLNNDQIITHYKRRFPRVASLALKEILSYQPAYFFWGGADLFHVTDAHVARRMVLIENNSCPSGNKSMPLASAAQPLGGYAELLEKSFLPLIKSRPLPDGVLAVVYDKNQMENSGYAAVLADLTGETVYLAPFKEATSAARFTADGILRVRDERGQWRTARAALRYVTQSPWRRIPLKTRTLLYNPVLACLAGGRNKLMAHVAYETFNRNRQNDGLAIAYPETTRGLTLSSIPQWLFDRGGIGVIKDPYSNAGQGVWTIVNRDELRDFLGAKHRYDRFIGQSLVGHPAWSAASGTDLHHVGTAPDRDGRVFAFDIRMIVATTPHGYKPVSLYARRAAQPLSDRLAPDADSWEILGTNLSRRATSGEWTTDENRLIPMDSQGVKVLGLGPDELIEAYVQTVMSAVAIDRMARELMLPNGEFDAARFRALDDDAPLMKELGYG